MENNWKKINILEYRYVNGEDVFRIINSHGRWFVTYDDNRYIREVNNVRDGKDLVEGFFE